MNKLRPRTIRRYQTREALRGVGLTHGHFAREFTRTATGDSNDRPAVFEVQRRDKSGKWRKAAGVDRVHTFGLARLRANRTGLVGTDGVRVRNTATGDVFPV